MKHPKQHAILGQPASKYLPVGRNKTLASALLRMSEKTVNQELNKKKEVIYCDDEEPFNGWTNVAPNPRFSEDPRPKKVGPKKKKLNKKTKNDLERFDRKTLPLKDHEISQQEIEQSHAYATLRNMYDNYKKSIRAENIKKKKQIIDPETYEYIPWNERKEDETENGKIKLPAIKMLNHPAQHNKLLEVLEKYGTRDKKHPSFATSTSNNPESLQDAEKAFDHYKYRWNFEKENQNPSDQRKKLRKRKDLHVHLPSLTSQSKENDNVQPRVKEKLVRFVNGTVYTKQNSKERPQNDPHASYINIQANRTKPEAGMVKLERKKEMSSHNGRPADHWVARVIIRDPEATGSKQPKGFKAASSVIIVPDARWKRKLGVIEAERERIQKEMERIQYQQQQELKLNQLRKRLLQNNNYAEGTASYGKQQMRSRRIPPVPSVVETSRVSVKYNVETLKRRGIVREISEDGMITPYLPGSKVPPIKPVSEKISLETAPNQRQPTTKVTVDRVSSPESKLSTSETGSEDNRQNRRLFLNPGAAQKKKNKKKKALKTNKIKLPNLNISEKSEISELENAAQPLENSDHQNKADAEVNLSDDVIDVNDMTSLPKVVGEGATFHNTMNNETPSSLQSPISSAPHLYPLMEERKDTSEPTKKTPPKKTAKYIRYKVVEHPGTQVTSRAERKHLHLLHSKNRGQEKLQDLVGQEKEMLSSVIDHIRANWKIDKLNQPTQSSSHTFTNGGHPGHVTTKHPVIPPILDTLEPSDQPTNEQLDVLSEQKPIDVTIQDGAGVTSQSKTLKRRRVTLQKQNREKSVTNTMPSDAVNTFDEVMKGDVIMKQRATSQLLEHSFAASISAVKPSRRIVNIAPAGVMQKA